MVHYPEVQQKAQAELDRVLNHGRRLPGYEDQPDLPYITAVMKEILRWQPVAPFGELRTIDLKLKAYANRMLKSDQGCLT